MDTNKMREQFEAWHRSVVEGEPPHEKYSDGSYVNPHVNRYWAGWQASRETLVVELPNSFEIAPPYACYEGGWNDMHGEAVDAIEAQGLKVKP
ncbi:hypothetical protein [Pseudomonas chlororaphis]|uniref:hypothetical protein n=1 Tax=Pseudomonas chlororaphis TaxID=587753 RepID=UPI0023666401|nr:hypothetical protein [Pseudomonas chlororaphis]WDH25020.1 hypothetical protein PUP50_12330 [Pseudomonas chlororaphis]